jgi:hypothetical protein
MRKRKLFITITVAAALTLAIAGSAYAATAGKSQGYQGGQAAATGGAANGAASTQRGDQDQARLRDGTGENCDGTCDASGPQGTVAQKANGQQAGPPAAGQGTSVNRAAGSAGTTNGATVQQQERTRSCDGTCVQDQTQTRSQQRLQDGSGVCSGK